MPKLPKLPNLPDPENALSIIDKAGDALDKGLGLIDKAADRIDRFASKLGPPKERKTTQIATQETTEAIKEGTACLPCSRDHLSTASSSLSEAIRFARDKGVKDSEVLRRVRIALDELNAMERIDLAPTETAKLKGAEKELANWTLSQSRSLRHDITAIKDIETLEQVAANAAGTTEAFIEKFWAITQKEEQCDTCEEARESIKQFIDKRKRERGEI
jgi:hypothetical protein